MVVSPWPPCYRPAHPPDPATAEVRRALLDHLDQHTVGQGRWDQKAISASVAERREGQAGVALDEAMRGEEILDREAHAEDSLSGSAAKSPTRPGPSGCRRARVALWYRTRASRTASPS
jgi:hypothetical protein